MAKIVVSFKMDESFLDIIDSVVIRKNIKRSVFIRNAIIKYLRSRGVDV